METLSPYLNDLRLLLPPPLAEVLLVVVSVVCGAIVGAERERAEKPAGLRTLTLICLGSTVFTLMSIDPALGPADRTRIAAQIVTGVGFLGAGAILRERGGVVGLTTAASIWAVAAVGIVVGAGYALAALALSLAIFATLSLMSRVEKRFIDPCRMTSLKIVYHPREGKTRLRIQGVLDAFDAPVSIGEESTVSAEREQLTLRYCRAHRPHRAFVADLAEIPDLAAFEPLREPATAKRSES